MITLLHFTGAFLQLHVQNEYSVCRVFEPRALYLEPGALEPYIATLNIEDPPPTKSLCFQDAIC